MCPLNAHVRGAEGEQDKRVASCSALPVTPARSAGREAEENSGFNEISVQFQTLCTNDQMRSLKGKTRLFQDFGMMSLG